MRKDGPGNAAHLLRIWLPALASLAVSLWWLIALALRGFSGWGRVAVGAGALLPALLVIALRVLYRRRIARAFLELGPEALIAHSQNVFSRSRVPHARLMLATATASYRAVFGEYGRALDALDEQEWSEAPGLYRASMLQVRALLHYLSGDDCAAGLRDVLEAEELARVPAITPGAKTSQRVLATYRDIGLVLTQGATPELARGLDRRAAATKDSFERLLTLWGAGLAYERLGERAEADRLLGELHRRAPHCLPLQSFARAVPPGVPSVASAEQAALAVAPRAQREGPGACARHPSVAATSRCVRCGSFACAACSRSISAQAAICFACHERYRELREEHLRHESRLRALGLFGQLASVGVVACGVGFFFFARHSAGPFALFGGVAYMTMLAGFYFASGRALRRLQLGSRRRVWLITAPMIALLPVGTAAAAYFLWLGYGPLGRVIYSLDYDRAVAATPELRPRSPWPLALGVGCALLLNLCALPVVLVLSGR